MLINHIHSMDLLRIYGFDVPYIDPYDLCFINKVWCPVLQKVNVVKILSCLNNSHGCLMESNSEIVF
jgi:hypothetical protein